MDAGWRRDHHAAAVQDHRELGLGQQLGGLGDGLSPPAGRSKSTIAGSSMSITWVQKSRGMLIWAGAEARLAFRSPG
jgi:hypothetical protein